MKTPKSSPQTIELSPRCSEQARSKGPSNGPRNEDTEHECADGVLRAPHIIRPLSHANAQFKQVV